MTSNPLDFVFDSLGNQATDLQTNYLFYTNGVASSVQFDLLQTGVPNSRAWVENASMGAIDLTLQQQNNADNFFELYLPLASAFASVEFRLGSSTSDYYELTGITTDALDNSFGDGWNLIKVPFADMDTVGDPDITAISYIRVTVVYDGSAQNQILLNQFYSRIGRIYDIEYYSKYMFRDAETGSFKENTTTETDYINLDTDGLNLMVFALLGEVVQQQQGADALYYDANAAEQGYRAALAGYKQRYRSEIIKPRAFYYRQPNASYRRWFGRPNR